jgi:hypothetical protein
VPIDWLFRQHTCRMRGLMGPSLDLRLHMAEHSGITPSASFSRRHYIPVLQVPLAEAIGKYSHFYCTRADKQRICTRAKIVAVTKGSWASGVAPLENLLFSVLESPLEKRYQRCIDQMVTCYWTSLMPIDSFILLPSDSKHQIADLIIWYLVADLRRLF